MSTRTPSLTHRRLLKNQLNRLHIPAYDNSEEVRYIPEQNRDNNLTVNECCELFQEFVLENFRKENLQYDELLLLFPEKKITSCTKARVDLSKMTRELESSKERKNLKDYASQIDMSVDQESYFDILHGVLSYQINIKQVLLLFYFCSDVATVALTKSTNLCKQFINWSLTFMIKHICPWVQYQGGWDNVFKNPSISLYRFLLLMAAGALFLTVFRYLK
ncbi:apoptosis regulator BAX-like [Physella acuta]|uniref:apoptosis regulator BAX-like n=1 Tax=Physella acuta TaxID=109671 RepID=UPI0027DC222D|nr:apoptosis regulator BAX-like [Physella acuta]XP_059171684.1 apoptosis regulator BAX-like [Physella acuta]XP_059171685.1 apoptosis regulator BAX-like [Physella acuta]